MLELSVSTRGAKLSKGAGAQGKTEACGVVDGLGGGGPGVKGREVESGHGLRRGKIPLHL